jgi:hypothetical protein
MRKLAALVAFIKSLDYTASKNVRSEFVIDHYQPYGHAVNNQPSAICLYDRVYSAVIRIDQLPVKHSPDKVFSQIACWLHDNDKLRYRYEITRGADGELIPLADPDINITDITDKTAALELIVPFREPVFGVLDSTGEYSLDGKKYRLVDPANPAENFESFYIINAYDSKIWRRTN